MLIIGKKLSPYALFYLLIPQLCFFALTGLPTSNGIDVGGNPYGIDLSSSFDHSFQDLGNSYHNDFHHD